MIRYFVLVFFFCFITLYAAAQSPQQIEADLLKSFKKINPANSDNSDVNDQFAKKLYNYASHNPATINYPFNALKETDLDIATADDGQFRIYSWDTEAGGTLHYFESVFQYKSGTKTMAVLDTPRGDGDVRPGYDKLYTVKANGHNFYLAVYLTIGSTKDAGGGVQVFTIEDGKLNENARLIKTGTGRHSRIDYNFNFFSEVDWKVRPTTYYDAATQTLHIPLIASNGNMTHNYIIYKFTGQYFERVKN
jgi:hypothetical protein